MLAAVTAACGPCGDRSGYSAAGQLNAIAENVSLAIYRLSKRINGRKRGLCQ